MAQKSTLLTPRARVSFLGSAKSGTHHAWLMRLTSFALLPLTIAFILIVLSLPGRDFQSARILLGSPCPAILLLLFVSVGIYHMTLGMQVIIEDYIHGAHAKHLALMANTCFGLVLGAASVYAVLRLSFT
ncbi:succinate dehydrogenase, hydrophobic membrane anchor protein [Rhodoblastus sp.]|jgi:succinate dehydrogenase / fumarate reductase membrane anchor subunit|uniref:succinate dehydrogenase, hydrophobic membrane anchor protein n=1 Tax=Rhodoblastus sp. TaxID=1962975 RepID=UPI0025D7C841|nr:succinate dehydrogenase, hydrophobic membrane anchor protein [Rhodoblastus sp.]